MMWYKVDFDNMAGKMLIHDRTYTVKEGEKTFEATFNYCEYEYWWTCTKTKKEVRVDEFLL